MKFLLVFAVLLVAFWVWRNNRQQDRTDAPPARPRTASSPTRMVACDLCAMHLPEHEAVRGREGVYCCHEHRRQAEASGS